MYSKNPPKKLLLALKNLRGKRCIITFHSLADLDACASAISLASFLGKNAIVAMQDCINSQSRKIIGPKILARMQKFSLARKKFPKAPVIVLDCNEKGLLPALGDGARGGGQGQIKILIDHHAKTPGSINADSAWIDPESSSASQMVSLLVKKPDDGQARLLLLGIISDSANFANSNPDTFMAVSRLLKTAVIEFSQLQEMLHVPKSPQSRMNILEGLRNVSFCEKGGLICATAQVPSHESHVAEILVRSGADCAFAACASKKECAISARMKMAHISSVDLPEIMREVGEVLGGSGGGHPAAAGASGPKAYEAEEALDLCQRLFFAHSTARIQIK
ncbi:MAG: DHH family phosphoesterase [Candidatus Micrarchaeota archaeon]